MADFKRYVARTEAWARTLDEPEDVVGSTGVVHAAPGDVLIVQHLRGETFTYVMTTDDFAEDWREPTDVDTEPATSESGTDTLPGAQSPSTGGDNTVDTPTPVATTPTVGTAGENPTPADTPADTATDTPAPAPTATDPTSAAPGDGDVQGTAPTDTPQVGSGTPDAVTPDPAAEPAPAPDTSNVDVPTPEPAQPDTTTPTQTVAPSQDPAGEGTVAEATTPTEGGDAGTAPTPNVDNPDPASTGNDAGTPVTTPDESRPQSEPTPEQTAAAEASLTAAASGKHEDTTDLGPTDDGIPIHDVPEPVKVLPAKAQGKANGK